VKHSTHTIAAAVFTVGLLLLGAGCKSAADWRQNADDEAYKLVTSRRDKLELQSGAFTIEPAENSMRQRILRGEDPGQTPLSLVQSLEIAAENSREYQSRKERLYLSALDLTLERWRFVIQKGGTLNALVQGTGEEAETANAGANFSLSKLLGSGALIIGNLGLNLTRGLLSSDGWHPTSDLGVSVTQPLLAGFGEQIVMEPLTQAERNLVYEVRAFERFRRTFALDVASSFYRLLQLADIVKNQENNVDNLEKLSERNKALAESGRLSDIEVGQARQEELSSKNNLLLARQRLEAANDQFKLILGLPITYPIRIDSGAMVEIEREKDARIDYDENVATQYALANRLDHLTVLDEEADRVRKVAVAEDALRAAMSVSANAALVSADGQPLNFDPSNTTWALGLNLSLPFERLPQRNNYREAIINHEAAKRASADSEDQIRAGLRDDLRSATNRRDSYTIQVSAVELATRRIESTRLKLDAGRADTRDLLEAQDSLLTAQNAVTGALIDYTLSRLRLFLDMELLRFDDSGIRVEPERLEATAERSEAMDDAQRSGATVATVGTATATASPDKHASLRATATDDPAVNAPTTTPSAESSRSKRE
jgi:outer membrane protein TolC